MDIGIDRKLRARKAVLTNPKFHSPSNVTKKKKRRKIDWIAIQDSVDLVCDRVLSQNSTQSDENMVNPKPKEAEKSADETVNDMELEATEGTVMNAHSSYILRQAAYRLDIGDKAKVEMASRSQIDNITMCISFLARQAELGQRSHTNMLRIMNAQIQPLNKKKIKLSGIDIPEDWDNGFLIDLLMDILNRLEALTRLLEMPRSTIFASITNPDFREARYLKLAIDSGDTNWSESGSAGLDMLIQKLSKQTFWKRVGFIWSRGMGKMKRNVQSEDKYRFASFQKVNTELEENMKKVNQHLVFELNLNGEYSELKVYYNGLTENEMARDFIEVTKEGDMVLQPTDVLERLEYETFSHVDFTAELERYGLTIRPETVDTLRQNPVHIGPAGKRINYMPERDRNGPRGKVIVHNRHNAPQEYKVNEQDRDNGDSNFGRNRIDSFRGQQRPFRGGGRVWGNRGNRGRTSMFNRQNEGGYSDKGGGQSGYQSQRQEYNSYRQDQGSNRGTPRAVSQFQVQRSKPLKRNTFFGGEDQTLTEDQRNGYTARPTDHQNDDMNQYQADEEAAISATGAKHSFFNNRPPMQYNEQPWKRGKGNNGRIDRM